MYLLHYNSQKEVTEAVKYITSKLPTTQEFNPNILGIIILGGDGTLLEFMFNHQFELKVKIYFFNFGSFGFLSCFSSSELCYVIDTLASRDFSSMSQIKAYRLLCNGMRIMNDVLIQTKGYGVLNEFVVMINGYQFNVRCDSILVSGAAGSSGLNYSAQGPLIKDENFVINFIHPCRTRINPIVLNKTDRLEITVIKKKYGPLCVLDGNHIDDSAGVFDIFLCKEPVNFMSLKNENDLYIERLKTLMGFKNPDI